LQLITKNMIAIAALLLAVSACGVSKGKKTDSDPAGADQNGERFGNGGKATVGDSGEFLFLMDTDKAFQWDMTAKRELEYEWRVLFKSGDAQYEIGYSRKSKGGNSNDGSLQQLVADGASDIRTVSGDEFSAVSQRVSTEATDRGVLVKLNDAEILGLILKDRPEALIFRARGSLQEPQIEQPILVHYQ